MYRSCSSVVWENIKMDHAMPDKSCERCLQCGYPFTLMRYQGVRAKRVYRSKIDFKNGYMRTESIESFHTWTCKKGHLVEQYSG